MATAHRFRPNIPPWFGVIAGIALVFCGLGCRDGKEAESRPPSAANITNAANIRPKVVAFCGDCHAVPLPESFPADAWYSEVKRGFDFYHRSGRSDLTPPPMNEVVRYYRALAPPRLPLVEPQPDAPGTSGLAFDKSVIALKQDAAFAAVSHLRWEPAGIAPAETDSTGLLTVADMQSGEIQAFRFSDRKPSTLFTAVAGNPAHVESCDLDADGNRDWVVADLGSFLPADHDRGRVLWLRHDPQTGDYDTTVLADGLGRVADVRAADFDDDDDLDLVVAEFGWQETGRILLLEQTGNAANHPEFQTRELDPRHGSVHVAPCDLDGDGRIDFAALISQEHEVVEAFLNRGAGEFERKTIFAFDDPSFGSSGIQVVDLDADGDLDLVSTNGDSLDGYLVKPYHAIHWLENRGTFPFVDHVLTTMPGVFRAVASDMDGDNDLDIVACSYLPRAQIRNLPPYPLDSLIWLEQVAEGEFVRHRLEQSERGHVALEVGDFDGDGDADLAVGNFANAANEASDWVTLWWNQRQVGGQTP